ncbi:ABC transporter ATP-binding protein [Helcococcus ovis]|uniref:ABC transporter transmembrane domain-containing protein n=1 Tax=Helcococcus ovis TaxID=72026 RepID=UPI0010701E0B|nr:ABC transporter ATP-binding protein [Helcococcus ovis]TFF66699.1 ABC transporter ATP-binding protein [Helcococcus ovis]WNZ00840.1 ABC transporter ATP-binding protein [Helcococcus ovis]
MNIKNYISNNKKSVFKIVLYTFLSILFISLIPICTKLVIDNYKNLNLQTALGYGTLYIFSILLFLLFEYKKKISIGWFGAKYSIYIKGKVFESITKMNAKKLNQKTTGDIINSIIRDTETIYENYIYCYISLYISIISFLVYIAYMFYLSWILTIAIIISSAISFFIPKIVGEKMKDKRRAESDKNAEFVSIFENLMEGKEIFDYNTSEEFVKKFDKYNVEHEMSVYNLVKYISFTNIFSGGSLYFINIVTFILGIVIVSMGMMEIGSFMALIGFVDLVAIPIRDMIYLIITIKSSSKIIDKLDFYLEDKNEDLLKEKIINFEKIELRNLSYSINDFSMNGINMTFSKGKKYAIIGENGSGKSTVMKLLSKKLNNSDNQIFIDGIDINTINTNEILMYVSNLFVLNDSALENIKISNPNNEPNFESLQIIESLKSKDINGLSMGEKDRVNIARAINSYKPIIILDEFFANIDKNSEIELTKLLLKTNKTIIIVTHNNDEEYLRMFDEVYKFKK